MKPPVARPVAESAAPAIILVWPQLAENIGTAARAMMNCGLSDLRLVRPRPVWPSERAAQASSGADAVLASARLFDTAADAIADLRHVYAASARKRDMEKPVTTPRLAAAEMRALIEQGESCGILFGPERTGLENDDIVLADTVVSVPLNPLFSSLNLAQAVLLLGYEWFQTSPSLVPLRDDEGTSPPAPKGDLINFLTRLEAELDDCGFLRHPQMRPTMVRNVRNLFQRAAPTDQELRTMHGVLTCLLQRPHRPPGGPEKSRAAGEKPPSESV
ncbi:MAG: RNA methyltransferase [Rhodospirillaceae bacterium]|nr:RNA methyltransferase [Rhodospirillaceae bacterium]